MQFERGEEDIRAPPPTASTVNTHPRHGNGTGTGTGTGRGFGKGHSGGGGVGNGTARGASVYTNRVKVNTSHSLAERPVDILLVGATLPSIYQLRHSAQIASRKHTKLITQVRHPGYSLEHDDLCSFFVKSTMPQQARYVAPPGQPLSGRTSRRPNLSCLSFQVRCPAWTWGWTRRRPLTSRHTHHPLPAGPPGTPAACWRARCA